MSKKLRLRVDLLRKSGLDESLDTLGAKLEARVDGYVHDFIELNNNHSETSKKL